MRFLPQVCSAVQNQDFTVVDDYITGLKALLYLKGIQRLKDWDGQSPPTPVHQKGKPVLSTNSSNNKVLPNFGEFLELKKEAVAEQKANETLDEGKPQFVERKKENIKVPKIENVIGASLPHIGAYKKLDNTKQVVALINDVIICILPLEVVDMQFFTDLCTFR